MNNAKNWGRPFKSIENGRRHKAHLIKYRDDDYAVAACNCNVVLSCIPVDPNVFVGDLICEKCFHIEHHVKKES